MEPRISNIWHPFTQMKLSKPPIHIKRGKGSWLFDDKGNKYLDAISSWWVTIHGHAHPYMAQKIKEQLDTLEHCIFADFTHSPAENLVQRLLTHLPEGISKAFFSDNGSTAVEVALKMAIQYWHNKSVKKSKIIALKGAYHGDTFGAMSAAERSPFSAAFGEYLFNVHHIDPPFTSEDACLIEFESLCKSGDVALFIYEPLLQGAGGMVMYSASGLNKLLAICKKYDVISIADEVMTGFYRTGDFFASNKILEKPDIMCLSKGLTGGVLPMSLTVCNEKVYQAFWSDDKLKAFFHGHSFTGNPVGCAAALASLDLIESSETWDNVKRIENNHRIFLSKVQNHERVKNVRMLGTVIALDVLIGETDGYFNKERDRLYQLFLDRGILLRPLGNVLYIMPPYCTSDKDLEMVYQAVFDVLDILKNA